MTGDGVLGASPHGAALLLDSQERGMERLAGRTLLATFLMAAMLPYLTPFPSATDTQPYALALALVLSIVAVGRKVPLELALLTLPLLGSTLFLAAGLGSFTSVRSFANYATIAFVPHAAYLVRRDDPELFRRVLSFAVYVWLAGGLAQALFGPDLFAAVLPSVRTSPTRGVTSLAPEPTHYGMQCLFLMLLVFMEFKGHRRMRLGALLIVQILLLAQSTMAALFLMIGLVLYVVGHLTTPKRALALLGYVVVAVGLLALAFKVQLLELQGSRLMFLILQLFRDPSYLFLLDQSGNQRLSNIVFSFYGFMDSGGLPHGFGTFAEYARSVAGRFQIIEYPAAMDRIMSGYGAALFELGLLGLVIPLAVTIAFWKRFRGELASFIVYSGLFHAMLLTAIPLANPVIGLTIGVVAAGAPRSFYGET